MVRWLSRFFNYLDRYYIQRHNLHPLNDVGLLVFRGEWMSGWGRQGGGEGGSGGREPGAQSWWGVLAAARDWPPAMMQPPLSWCVVIHT